MLTLLSGILYAKFGGAAFLPMAILCAVAFPLAWLGFADERNRNLNAAKAASYIKLPKGMYRC